MAKKEETTWTEMKTNLNFSKVKRKGRSNGKEEIWNAREKRK